MGTATGGATSGGAAGGEAAGGLDVLLARLSDDAASLTRLPLRELDGPAAAAARRVLRLVGDQVQVASATLLAAVEADGRWAAGGADRTVAGWAARREGVAFGAARRELTLGRALADLPVAREAVVSGQITAGHADAIAEVGTSSAQRRAALTGPEADRNEAFLVEQARLLPVDEFRKVARRWAVAVDGAAAEREHTDAVLRESLVLARRRDGLALSGFLTHEHGAVLETALRSVAGVPSRDDERTPDQRRAAALTDLSRLVLDRGLSGQGAQVRPHLSVLVPFETLTRLADDAAGDAADAPDSADDSRPSRLLPPAELESGEPLPASVLARIACDSEITRVVFGPTGQVLDVGQTERTYSKELRRAVIVRDRHCRYPTCTAPPPLGEVHHIRWFCRGGVTSVENGILLCWYHHELVHRLDLRIARVDHGFVFTRPDGSVVRPQERGVGDHAPADPGVPRLAPGGDERLSGAAESDHGGASDRGRSSGGASDRGRSSGGAVDRGRSSDPAQVSELAGRAPPDARTPDPRPSPRRAASVSPPALTRRTDPATGPPPKVSAPPVARTATRLPASHAAGAPALF